MNEPSPTRVLIAIPTFRRPDLLEQLLRGISGISIPNGCTVEALVLDNDSVPSARDLVERTAQDVPFSLSYAHVRDPGLSSVRNVALNRGRNFDVLVMIDDDETPQAQWLAELLAVQRATGADAVIGPVPRVLPKTAPRWLHRGRFFESPEYPDRTLVHDGYSGNCLLQMSSVSRFNMAFEETLNFAGGEDLLFFRQLVQRGGTIAFAAHAVAVESVGPERATAAYILKLHFRRGNTLSLCDAYLSNAPATLGVRALKSAALILRGCITLLPYALVRGRAGGVIALCDIVRGAGALTGIFGFTYNAYAREALV